MKIPALLSLFALLALSSCQNGPKPLSADARAARTALLTKQLSSENLPSQTFHFDNAKGDILQGEQGCRFHIDKHAFVDANGKVVEGEVEVELKEALTLKDRVLGNLTTTSNGRALQSGGMFYLNASANGEQLHLAEGTSISACVPTDSVFADMSLFVGEPGDNQALNWINPVPIPEREAKSDSIQDAVDLGFEKAHNVMYWVDGFFEGQFYPDTIVNEVYRLAWEGTGLKLNRDSSFVFDGYTVHFIKQDRLWKWSDEFEQGTNTYVTDPNASYIFELYDLGWANIDRLYTDPRTEEIELITSVQNQADFEYVHTTLLIQSMYLPGYQRMDDTYCFTHGDFETTQLPVGERATILATATQGDQTFFAYQTFDLAKAQTIQLELKPTSGKEMEAVLAEEL